MMGATGDGGFRQVFDLIAASTDPKKASETLAKIEKDTKALKAVQAEISAAQVNLDDDTAAFIESQKVARQALALAEDKEKKTATAKAKLAQEKEQFGRDKTQFTADKTAFDARSKATTAEQQAKAKELTLREKECDDREAAVAKQEQKQIARERLLDQLSALK